ncbi:hypothetical protein BSK59_13780 [Paenibacillus odorifer]|uniref:hypothetical protein n=1 Tax=Paenibacillus odorifer TaxID=189426 RepID=UPI00096DAB79|nr:hypothetical protein [Paenibacillus odorifer]OME55541.1 hypothetical protein BSK59_13780 [Paenibacillus odorifer]
MARKVKCNSCGNLDEHINMTKNDKGKYFHIGECFEKHLAHRKLIEDENRKLNELYQYIKDLHGIPKEQNIHSSVMWRIQELRNGNDIYQGKKERKYRVGVEYDLLLSAYKLKEKDIKWFIENVLQDQVDAKDVSKCLTIALKGLAEAWRLEELKKKREVEKEKQMASTKEDTSHFTTQEEIRYTRQKDDLDISNLL